MTKSIQELSYTEMLIEREKVKTQIKQSKSIYFKKDRIKYLNKLNKELATYERLRFGGKIK